MKTLRSALLTYVEEVKALGVENPYNPSELILWDKVIVETVCHRDHIRICFIRSLEQGHGFASRALKEILTIADKHKLEVTLNASSVPAYCPNRELAMTTNQLKRWYARHGFMPAGINKMVRPAKLD